MYKQNAVSPFYIVSGYLSPRGEKGNSKVLKFDSSVFFLTGQYQRCISILCSLINLHLSYNFQHTSCDDRSQCRSHHNAPFYQARVSQRRPYVFQEHHLNYSSLGESQWSHLICNASTVALCHLYLLLFIYV